MMKFNQFSTDPNCMSMTLVLHHPLNLVGKAKSGIQSVDLDGVGSIPAIPKMQIACFVDHFNKLE
jgi:hypothetical protein